MSLLQILNDRFEYKHDGLYYKKAYRKNKVGDRAGTIRPDGYRQLNINNKSYYEHRLIWLLHKGILPSELLDHIDRNKQNNAIENLREATVSENGRNQKCKGYTFFKNRYVASIRVNKQLHYLGRYKTKEEAVAVRKEAEKKYFGEFAPQ